MNWLRALAMRLGDTEELAAVLHALQQGADNAEGIGIPHFVLRIFATLPAVAGELTVPNYLANFLTGTLLVNGQAQLHVPSLETFQTLWKDALAVESPAPLSVLEPACGSANDFRFLQAYGIARLVNYTGFDLCARNVENARALFPHFRFEVGNVFAIQAPDKAYDFCFVHDLLEHLSLEGMQTAVQELCRVTRRGLCVGFFNMDEISTHLVQPVEEYHWNKLSMARMKELFAAQGFKAQAVHIGSFLRQHTGCEQTHNPNAYTFLTSR